MSSLPYSTHLVHGPFFFRKNLILISLCIVFIGYVLFQIRFLVFGNTLRVYTPTQDRVFTTEPALLFSGNAYRAEKVSLNGALLPIDSKGYFEKTVFLPPGETVYVLSIENSFQKKESETITVVKSN